MAHQGRLGRCVGPQQHHHVLPCPPCLKPSLRSGAVFACRRKLRCIKTCAAAASVQPSTELNELAVQVTPLQPEQQPVQPVQDVQVQPPATTQPSTPASKGAAHDPATRARLWKAAIKLPMYSVGYIPVMVAGAAVLHHTGVAPLLQLLGYAVASVFIIAWLNLSNDAFDSHTGVDESKPESVVNLTGNHTLVAVLAVAFFAAGTGLLAWLLGGSGDPRPAALLAFSIVCGYVYQGPPFRLSYKGLGEPLCFMAFGPSATTAFYLAMRHSTTATAPATAASVPSATAAAVLSSSSSITSNLQAVTSWVPGSVWACSLLVGLTTTIILFTSHFHQIEGDKAAGKMSPLVRLGAARGLQVLRASVTASYVLACGAALCQYLPLTLLPMLCFSLPAAGELLRFATENHLVPARIAPLKRFACMWHIAFGSSLVAGLLAPRVLAALLH